jgi:hypothetical protein
MWTTLYIIAPYEKYTNRPKAIDTPKATASSQSAIFSYMLGLVVMM